MRRPFRVRVWILLLLLVALAPAARAAPFGGRRAEFADPSFRTVWERTDAPQVQAGRTFFWGPQPWFDTPEPLRQGQNGLRTVQYFDKARMEINDTATRSYHGGVTNGLLVVEMVSGDLRLGMDVFDTERRPPSQVPVAGDVGFLNPGAPTYASFAGVATIRNNGYTDPERVGQPVIAAIDQAGNLSPRSDLGAAHPEAAISYYETSTGHNVAGVFRSFTLQQGAYLENGAVRRGLIIDPVFTTGLPITDPYWMRAKVGGVEKDVLVQLFERRVLTYVADNPAGYKVEMGNVGQHYFQWRYPYMGRPWEADSDPILPLVVASTALSGDHFEVVDLGLDSRLIIPVTSDTVESLPFSYRHAYDYKSICILIDSRRGDTVHRQIYQVPLGNADGCQERRITFSDGTPPPAGEQAGYVPSGSANDFNPSISPDGTKIVFASDREGLVQLYIVRADGGGFPTALLADGCTNEYPSWGPDGRTLYWERQCSGGHFQIMRGDLVYTGEGNLINATLADVRALTGPDFDSRYPRMRPDGSMIAFTAYRDGNGEIYMMDRNGAGVTRLTENPAEDEAPSWNTDGRILVFASNRRGGYQIYGLNLDTRESYQMTTDGENRWPLIGW